MGQLEGWRSRGGEHVGGGGDIRVRELVPRLSTRHDDRTRHLKQVLERIGDTLLHGVNKFLNGHQPAPRFWRAWTGTAEEGWGPSSVPPPVSH